MNQIFLRGNIGNAAEIRNLESGAKVAKFSFATNETFKDKNGEKQTVTEWHSVIAWRGLAELIEKYTDKGSSLLIVGKVTYRQYEKDGEKKYYTEVIANKIDLLDKKLSSGYFPEETPPERNTAPDDNGLSAPELEPAATDGDLPF